MGTWIGAVVQLIWDAGQPLAIGAAGRFRSGQLETAIGVLDVIIINIIIVIDGFGGGHRSIDLGAR